MVRRAKNYIMLHPLIKTEGIVISEKEFGENDKIFTLFTKEFGKIEVLGKAIRKSKAKLRFGLQILNHISLEFVRGKNFNIATDVFIKNFFLKTKEDFLFFRSSFYLVSLLDKLISGEEKDERIWNLLIETLFSLENKENKLNARYFEWNLLKFLGFEPELYYCVLCQKKIKEGKIYFFAKGGGLLCQDCYFKKERGKEVSRDFVKILRLIINEDKETLRKLKIVEEQKRELKEISAYYLSHILEEKIFVI